MSRLRWPDSTNSVSDDPGTVQGVDIENNWCCYPNPLEDSAQTCATFYDPGDSWESDFMAVVAPKRFEWAERWLPR